jgi:hypothetical protein
MGKEMGTEELLITRGKSTASNYVQPKRSVCLPEERPRALAFRLSGLVGQRLDDAVVGGVLCEVGEPEQRLTLAGEVVGHPGEGVVEVPDSDTDAALDLDASTDDLSQTVSRAQKGEWSV